MAAALSSAWVSLGGNQGETPAIFQKALARIVANRDIDLDGVSSLYRTPPWGDQAQPSFLNAVIRLKTGLEPRSLFEELVKVETALGRRRDPDRPWGPRTLDLDLLLFGERQFSEPDLTVPHPRLHERAFVLVPLMEIDPGLAIPGVGSVPGLLDRLDQAGIERVSGPSWAKRA